MSAARILRHERSEPRRMPAEAPELLGPSPFEARPLGERLRVTGSALVGRDVMLALQVEPELRAVTGVAAEPHPRCAARECDGVRHACPTQS